jgi:hypothetical protein
MSDLTSLATSAIAAGGPVGILLALGGWWLSRRLAQSEQTRDARAAEDRANCRKDYADLAKRLREIEDRSHQDHVGALRESEATKQQALELMRECVKSSGRSARALEVCLETVGIIRQERAAKVSAARPDESSQEFIIRDPPVHYPDVASGTHRA